MTAKEKIVVLYADSLHIQKTEEEGGGFLDGVTVSYLYGENMDPLMHANGSLGQRPAKAFLSPDAWGKFGSVPGLYEGSFDMSIDSKGKPSLRLTDADFIGLIQFSPVEGAKPSSKPSAAPVKEV